MPLVKFDEKDPKDVEHGPVGPVLTSGRLEVFKNSVHAGVASPPHTHDYEQIVYVLSGRLEVTFGEDRYEVGPGEASLNPAGIEHGTSALEDTLCIVVHGPAN